VTLNVGLDMDRQLAEHAHSRCSINTHPWLFLEKARDPPTPQLGSSVPVSHLPYQGWLGARACPQGTSVQGRRPPWLRAESRRAWPGPEETGSRAERARLAGALGQPTLGTGMVAETLTCGRLQEVEASFMALRMLQRKCVWGP
jgi:hypothetical protein